MNLSILNTFRRSARRRGNARPVAGRSPAGTGPGGDDVPVEVVVAGQNRKLASQDVSDFDRKMIATAAADPRHKKVPSLPIEEHREMYSRSGLGKAGLTETALFFAPRNAIALLELWRAIHVWEDAELRRKLSFAFNGDPARGPHGATSGAPSAPLNAQNQTYYIAPVYYEWKRLRAIRPQNRGGVACRSGVASAETGSHSSVELKRRTSLRTGVSRPALAPAGCVQ